MTSPARARRSSKAWSALALMIALLALASPAFGAERPHDAPDGPDREALPSVPLEFILQSSDGIRFAFTPIARERMRHLLPRAAAIRAELAARLGRPVLADVEVRVASGPAEMAALAPVELPKHARSVALSRQHLVLASIAAPLSLEPLDLEEVLRHGLAHLALDEAADNKPLPRWFHEGFAIDFSGEGRATRAHALFVASMRDRLLPLSSVDRELGEDGSEDSLAAAQAAEVVRLLGDSPGGPRLAKLVARVREGEPFEPALGATYEADLPQLERAFRKEVARRYGFVPVLLAGALLWVVVALVAIVRRLRARAESARRARRLEAREARAQVLAARARARAGAKPAEERFERIPIEPEVPKIEHDGRWYTLH
jgi:hypothetical protein